MRTFNLQDAFDFMISWIIFAVVLLFLAANARADQPTSEQTFWACAELQPAPQPSLFHFASKSNPTALEDAANLVAEKPYKPDAAACVSGQCANGSCADGQCSSGQCFNGSCHSQTTSVPEDGTAVKQKTFTKSVMKSNSYSGPLSGQWRPFKKARERRQSRLSARRGC